MNEIDRFKDLQRQGFMKPLRPPKISKPAQPTVACNGCLNWHPAGNHTASAAMRKANLNGASLVQRPI